MTTTEEMIKRRTAYVPGEFLNDCIDCDCLPVSAIEHPAAAPHGFLLMSRRMGGDAEIAVDAINFAELVSRANHYATEPELSSTPLGKSAAKTLKMLTEQGFDVEKALNDSFFFIYP
jgi:hypothetical protein